MDSVFFITIAVIFLSAILGVYTRRRSRDACLQDFADYQVTLELTNGALIWGHLRVYSTGIELLYRGLHRDSQGHMETSYVLFANELSNIRAIHRYHDELAPERQASRAKEIERSHHPGFFRRAARQMKNFVNTFSDAFKQTFSVAMSQVKKGPGAAVVKSQNKNLAALGGTMLGPADNAYEPILERYVGHRVVLEEVRGEEVVEHAGILKEYSSAWIELLDCAQPTVHQFNLQMPDQLRLNQDLDFIVSRNTEGGASELRIQVENHGSVQLYLKRLECGEWSEAIDAVLPPGGNVDVSLNALPEEARNALESHPVERLEFRSPARTPEDEVHITPDNPEPLPDIRLAVEGMREVDLCLPRSSTTLRHGGERLEG